ncbi:uncharacterized protein TNCV_1652751 [Trichonephila clavipes]|nr:uncharacterized protein TNCV_1652751 [Trichonephila clavipes]
MQTLKPQDQKTHLEFASRFLARMEKDDAGPWKILWSDEVIPALQERQCLQTTIFMQDGAIHHIGRQVKALLSGNFGDNRVISRHFPDAWLCPPDLNPCDFWLWGFLKDRVYSAGIRTLPDFKASIIRHVIEIPRELLRTTIENAVLRFQHVIDVNGAHIGHILDLAIDFCDEEVLGIFERKILRCILGGIQTNGSWRRRSNLELDKIFKQPDIVKLVKLQRLKWAGHLARMNEDRCCKKIFLAKPMGNRPRGGPPLRWIDCVEKDLYVFKVKNWKTVSKSRDAWRKLLEKVRAHPRLSSH